MTTKVASVPSRAVIAHEKNGKGFISFIKGKKGIHSHAKHVLDHFNSHFPKEKDDHFFHHKYTYQLGGFGSALKSYGALYTYLDISASKANQIIGRSWHLMDPDANRTKKQFEKHAENLKTYLKKRDTEVYSKLSLLEGIECTRLSEAMKALDGGCNLSAVVMAVSAVEHRLHKLIFNSNATLYKKEFERATLGGIIELFRKDSRYVDTKYSKLKRILPEKHRPLMEMLNVYRIFSAHPKDEIITHQTANAILTLSFLLLIDESLKA